MGSRFKEYNIFSITYLGTKPPITIERAASGKARNSVLESSDIDIESSVSEDPRTLLRALPDAALSIVIGGFVPRYVMMNILYSLILLPKLC